MQTGSQERVTRISDSCEAAVVTAAAAKPLSHPSIRSPVTIVPLRLRARILYIQQYVQPGVQPKRTSEKKSKVTKVTQHSSFVPNIPTTNGSYNFDIIGTRGTLALEHVPPPLNETQHKKPHSVPHSGISRATTVFDPQATHACSTHAMFHRLTSSACAQEKPRPQI